MATTTFLFTDIEGSTRRWDAHGEAMDAALVRHDDIIERTVAEHGGRVFKHTGDGLLSAFGAAGSAVRAAAEIQRALDVEDFAAIGGLKVRMAVHSGEATERDDDFFGPALNRASRIMDAARGGQVLLSATAAELVRSDLPAGHLLDDLGEHRLKDLGQPERIHMLTGPGLATDLGPVRSLERRPNNLPVQLTSFVGRDRELSEVRDLLVENRIVTLTGVGGVGKTRLAIQAAAESVDAFTDGVWLVELAPLAEAGLVLGAIASAAGITEEPSRALVDTVAKALGSGPVLLVLDNCEHLIDEVAKVTDDLLRRCPDLRILATSREGLAVGGERLWRCPSMMASGDAVKLFLDRAELFGGVDMTDAGTKVAVERICERLDGIPLAIELATARLKVFTAEQLASRLDDRFRLLTGGSRTAMPRQRTLQAAMDWSHDLLAEHERVLLRRLGVFHGGFTLESAERVCADDIIPDWEVLDLVTHLVDTSLVTFDGQEGTPRYRLLETVRQYAMDRLFDAAEADDFRRRHAIEFETMMRGADDGLLGPEADRWAEICRAEADNVRAALTWAFEADEYAQALRLGAAFSRYWMFTGHVAEASERLLQLLIVEHEDSEQLAEALSYLGHFLFLGGKVDEARPYSERSLEVAGRIGSESTMLRSMMVRANILNAEWKVNESLDSYQEIAERARASGDDYLQIALFNIAMNGPSVGRYDESRAAANEMVERAESSGQVVQIAMARSVAAISAFIRGDLDDSRRHVEAGERSGGAMFPQSQAGLRLSRANLALHDGDFDAAEQWVNKALLAVEQVGQPELLEFCHRLLGIVAVERGDLDKALDEFEHAIGRLYDRSTDGDEAAGYGSSIAAAAFAKGAPELAVTLIEIERLYMERRGTMLPAPWRIAVAELTEKVEAVLSPEQMEAAKARAASPSGQDIGGLLAELRAR